MLSFTMHLKERIRRCQEIRIQVVAAESGISEVAHLFCSLEGTAYQVTASLDMLVPWYDVTSERHIGSRLEAL